jgi:hypothetical protein
MNLFDIKFNNDKDLHCPTSVGDCIEWMMKYNKDARWDIISRAMNILQKGPSVVSDEHIQDKIQ